MNTVVYYVGGEIGYVWRVFLLIGKKELTVAQGDAKTKGEAQDAADRVLNPCVSESQLEV